MKFIDTLLIHNELINMTDVFKKTDQSGDQNDDQNMKFAKQRSGKQYETESAYATKRALLEIDNIFNKKAKCVTESHFDTCEFEKMVKTAYTLQRTSDCSVGQQSPEYWELQQKYTNLITDVFTYIKYRTREVENLQKDITLIEEQDAINQEEIEQYIAELDTSERLMREQTILQNEHTQAELQHEYEKIMCLITCVVVAIYHYAFGAYGLWYTMEQHTRVFLVIVKTIIMFSTHTIKFASNVTILSLTACNQVLGIN